MELHFNTSLASQLGLHEAIFLSWLTNHYDQSLTTPQQLLETFHFWSEEDLYQCLACLESQKLILVKRQTNQACLFSVNHTLIKDKYRLQLGHGNQNAQSPSVILDDNLKKHLRRFQSTDTLLNKKLTELVQNHSQELIEYAVSEGLNSVSAAATFDKFLHYVSANPDRFWNTDLISYWRFWISNSKEKQGLSNLPNSGKRSSIEKSNDYAASNWLQKKMTSDKLHNPMQLSQAPDTKKPT